MKLAQPVEKGGRKREEGGGERKGGRRRRKRKTGRGRGKERTPYSCQRFECSQSQISHMSEFQHIQ